jgi:hypothetical protein
MSMMHRCYNPGDAGYPRYGGRGITVCDEWHDMHAFIAYIGPRPSPQHSLDRYPDNNGPYAPGNVRWSTKREQAQNTRSNHLITFHGDTKPLIEWARAIGIHPASLRTRLERGWPLELALTLAGGSTFMTLGRPPRGHSNVPRT